VPPAGAPESTGSPHYAPNLLSNDHCHAQAVPPAAYGLCPRTSPTLPPNPVHAGHTNSPSGGHRDRKRVGRWSNTALESAKNVVDLRG
jgi:hypothetical protein